MVGLRPSALDRPVRPRPSLQVAQSSVDSRSVRTDVGLAQVEGAPTGSQKLSAVARPPAPDWRTDLLQGFGELVGCLETEITADRSPLNAFLVAIALQQILDDRLEPALLLDRIGAYLTGSELPGSALAATLAHNLGSGERWARSRSRELADMTLLRQSVTDLAELLAASVMAEVPDLSGVAGERRAPRLAGDRAASARTLLRTVQQRSRSLPDMLRTTTPVVPSCFQTFDLGLADVRRLGNELAEADSTRTPVVMIGVRTSGSYLAPLLAEVLRQRGFAAVCTITLRPGIPVSRPVADRVRAMAAQGARFVVTDDPPVTGSSMARGVDELERLGVPQRRIMLAYPRFIDTPEQLKGLSDIGRVTLGWEDWDVHRRLEPAFVSRVLGGVLGPAVRIESSELVNARRPRRAEAHVRAVYDVRMAVTPGGEPDTRRVVVQGVGIGYYGEHVVAVADTMPSFSTPIYALQDGLLFREWIDDTSRIDDTPRLGPSAGLQEPVIEALARYVSLRRSRLPARRDASEALAGSQPVWETAAAEISRSFGRAWPLAQLLAANALVRHVLRVSHPTVIDGTMELENWFTDPATGRLRSVGLQDRAYWHHGLSSYDPAFDLAGLVNTHFDVPSAPALLSRYATLTGDVVSPERWLLLRLVQLWGCRRRNPATASATRAAAARDMQRYFAAVFLPETGAVGEHNSDEQHANQAAGPRAPGGHATLCALDIDGVLESEHLGFPSLTISSAFALRALKRHGYSPVLATGRSLDEVRERCRAYGLVGGVAEYGSALYLTDDDEVVDLVPGGARNHLDRAREALVATPGVTVDPRYQFAIRATLGGPQGPRPLTAEVLKSLAPVLQGIRTVDGEAQTDFVATEVDKGTGLRSLTFRLTRTSTEGSFGFIDLAVGDTVSDLPMLEYARQGAMPAHASAVRADPAVWRTEAPYQRGLLEAVDRFLGHTGSRRGPRRGKLGRMLPHRPVRLSELGCETCRVSPTDGATDALLAILSATECGWASIPGHGFRAAFLTRKLTRSDE